MLVVALGYGFAVLLNTCLFTLQQEARLERQEQRLHGRAVNAALHGNIGKAVALEVSESTAIR